MAFVIERSPLARIVIPTLGRIESLTSTVQSVRSQIDTKEAEIVIVLDGTPAGPRLTPLLHHPVLSRHHVEVRSAGHRAGAAACRNIGASGVTAPYLIFLDDDVRLWGGWWEAVRSQINAGTPCITGPITTSQVTILAKARESRYRMRYENCADGGTVQFLAGGNCVLRTDVFLLAGGMPKQTVASDLALANRLSGLGIATRFVAPAVVDHDHDRGWPMALANAWESGSEVPRGRVVAELKEMAQRQAEIGVRATNIFLTLIKLLRSHLDHMRLQWQRYRSCSPAFFPGLAHSKRLR